MPVYLDEKTKKWRCVIRYVDFNGEKKQTQKRGFATKRDALAYERAFLTQKQYDGKTTYAEIWELFKEDALSDKRFTTVRGYESNMRLYILPFFGDRAIADIDDLMIRKWQNELKQQDFQDVYIRRIETNFRTVLRYGLATCKIDTDPSKRLKPAGSTKVREMDIWTLEEYKAFRGQINNARTGVMFDILYYAGLRVGELLALQVGAVDLDRSIIKITQSMQRFNKEDIITPPKTKNSYRQVAISSFLREELQEYISTLYMPKAEDLLFPVGKNPLYKAMTKYAAAASVKHIRLHDLRHSHASLLIAQGFDIMDISKRLGHEKVSTTLNIYGHLYEDKGKAIAARLDALQG